MEELEEKLKNNPNDKALFDMFKSMTMTHIDHAQSSENLLKNTRGKVTRDLLRQYPQSPTAKSTVEALNMIEYGFCTLHSYKKERVLTISDCQKLEPGFHNYIQGYMIADHLLTQYPKVALPRNIATWTEDYLRLRPNDTFVEYFLVSIVVPLRGMEKSDYEKNKDNIRALEQFAHKIKEYKSVESERRMLGHAYFVLGSAYIATDQFVRAFDSMRKFYETDKENLQAIYMYAYTKKIENPKSALELYEKYLRLAPKCHEKYANTLYQMSYIYIYTFKNVQKGKLFYEKAKNAEKFRLPFDGEVDLPEKQYLEWYMKSDVNFTSGKPYSNIQS